MKTTIKNLCGGLITLGLSFSIAFAQIPEKMTYQAVIRNSSGLVMTNTIIPFKLSIIRGDGGSLVYAEITELLTNDNGLITYEIGSITPETGVFSDIDWENGPYIIKTETTISGVDIIDSNYLTSVPYALYAKTAQHIVGGISSLETDPRFEASIARGITAIDTANWNKHTIDTDTQLNEATVDAFVADNGYLLTEVDGSITNEIEIPTGGNDGDVLRTNGLGDYSWINQTINTDHQNISGSILTGTDLTIAISGGSSEVVDLSTISDGDAWKVSGEDIVTDVGRTGRVGIGTVTPNHKLHVEGSVKITEMPNALLTDSIVFTSLEGEIKKMSVDRYTQHVVDHIFPPSEGTLSGASSACTGITISGVYTVGVILAASNSITVEVDVTTGQSFSTAGTYTISTATVNGYSFYKEGIFLNTGLQTVVIQASGEPINAGPTIFNLNYDGGSCSFEIPVVN